MDGPRLQGKCRQGTLADHRQAAERVIRMMPERWNFSLAEMAEVAYMSPYHFSRMFHRVVGLPPFHFLGMMRLQHAKRLLVVSGLRVIDVANEVGYNSAATFSRRFSSLVGVPPSKLRRLARSWPEEAAPLRHPNETEPGDETGTVLEGTVEIPSELTETVCVGAFPSPVPEGRPTGCTLAQANGAFRIEGLKDGRHYLLAMAHPRADSFREALLRDTRLLGETGRGPVLIRRGEVRGATRIRLRPPHFTDPPIVTVAPILAAMGNPNATRN